MGLIGKDWITDMANLFNGNIKQAIKTGGVVAILVIAVLVFAYKVLENYGRRMDDISIALNKNSEVLAQVRDAVQSEQNYTSSLTNAIKDLKDLIILTRDRR